MSSVGGRQLKPRRSQRKSDTSILSTWNKSPKALVATGPETLLADSSKLREVCFHLVNIRRPTYCLTFESSKFGDNRTQIRPKPLGFSSWVIPVSKSCTPEISNHTLFFSDFF